MKHPGHTLRDALGLTQVAFAAAVGVSQSRVSDVEAGRGNYGRDTILAIMDAFRKQCIQLGITAEDLQRGIDVDDQVAPV